MSLMLVLLRYIPSQFKEFWKFKSHFLNLIISLENIFTW